MVAHENNVPSERLLIVGWDGADWDILDNLMARGVLPNLSRVLSNGAKGTLLSTIPSHSWAAWSSFLTGFDPGGHGVYDFIERHPSDPTRHIPVTSTSLKAPTFLETLSERQHEVRAANIPVTFPPIPVRGKMIAGVAIPRGADPFYPEEWGRELANVAPFPLNGMEWTNFHRRPAELVDEAHRFVSQRTRSFLEMLRGQWMVAVCVYLAPDRLQHPFGRYLLPSHPDYENASETELAAKIRNVYTKLDEGLGSLMNAAGGNATTVLMSDHGFRPVARASNLSHVLQEVGFLTPAKTNQVVSLMKRSRALRRLRTSEVGQQLRRHVKPPASISWSKTRAYKSAAGGGVSLNLRGREPEGIVSPRDYDRAREEVRDALMSYTEPVTDENPVQAVRFKEELYRGPYVDLAPDMIVTARDLWTFSHADNLYAEIEWPSGMHRRAGIVVIHGGRNVDSDVGTREIFDLAASALAFCGEPVQHLHGSVIEHIAEPPDGDMSSTSGEPSKPVRRGPGLNESELEQVAEHLRNLGYIE